ncbi:MAG: GHKL domain-containing protein [Blautia sp.]|nr:GHKL domain-containing protein [Blautia sp.]
MNKRISAGGAAALAWGMAAAWNGWNDGMLICPVYLFILLLLYVIFDLRAGEAVRIFLVSFAVLSLAEIVLLYMLMVWGHFSAVVNNIVYTLIIIAGIWGFYALIGRRLERNVLQLPVKIKITLGIAVAVITIMVAYFLVGMHAFGVGTQRNNVMILLFGTIGIFTLLFILVWYLNDTLRQSSQNELLRQYQLQQQEYYENMLARETETRQFRHDMINHLLELQNFCRTGAYGQAETYLANLLEGITGISNSQYDVGNTAINVMLNHYLPQECKVIVEGYVSEHLGIEQLDLCTVVSNLVKNAVEALNRMKDTRTHLIITLNQGETYLRVYVENDMEGELCFDKDDIPATSKADKQNHGLGLRNVKSVAEKYEGSYKAEVENGNYKAEVTLNMTVGEEKQQLGREGVAI